MEGKILPTKTLKNDRLLRCATWLASQTLEDSFDDKSRVEAMLPSPLEDEKPEDIMSIPTAYDEDHVRPMKVSRRKLRTMGLRMECEWLRCCFVSSDPTAFQLHIASHIPHLPTTPLPHPKYKCLWDVCHHQSLDGREMVRHIKYHAYHAKLMAIGESTIFNLKLPQCKKESVKRNRIPLQTNDYTCRWVECQQNFTDIQEFFVHVSSHLQYSEVCSWAGCGVGGAGLRKHVRTHTGERYVACSHCGRHFANNNKLIEHRQRQNVLEGKSLTCSVCGKAQATAKLLQLHARQHVCVYACSYCDMTTQTLSALSLHIRYRHLSHRPGGRPFKCGLCDYASVTKNDLKCHMLRHNKVKTSPASENCEPEKSSTNKKYLCHLCPSSTAKVFSRGTRLTTHLVKNHGAQWPDGHCRFRYQQSEDGYYRLTTTRYESLEVSRQIIGGENSLIDPIDDTLNIKVTKKSSATKSNPTLYEVNVKNEEICDSELEDTLLIEKEELGEEELVMEHQKVEPSIEITMWDVDEEGNIIKSQIMDSSEVIIGL